MLAVTMIAGVGLVAPPPLVLFGALTVGPVLAAVAGRAAAVALVGAYTLLLATILAWTHRILWGSPLLLVYPGGIIAATVLSMVLAQLQHRAGQLAETNQVMLAAVGESSDDAVVIEGMDGMIRAWNPAAERMYGYLSSEALGRPVSLIVPSAEAAELPHLLRRVAGGEHVAHYEARRVAKDGAILDVSVNLAPIYDRHGTVVAAATTARDITGRKQAEALARGIQHRAALNERLESLGQLAGGVAHDFNNILAVILNYTEFVTEATERDPAARADLARIRGAAERAQALVRQLMVFARSESAAVEDLNLAAVINATRDLLAKTLGEQIKLVTKTPAQPVHVHADRGQIEQILLNLVLNARDAMPEGGTIVMEAAPVEVDADHGDLQPWVQPGRYVRLLVSDTGTGMSSEVITHAFEPFYTTKPKDKGVGLGLATVYGAVRQAGGAIKIYSELGIGTTIRVYLPAVDQPAATAEPSTEHPPPGQGELALVVEDEGAVRDMVVRILDRHGYRVLAADRGRLALDLAHEHSVDVLITDVIMPDMSGPDLVQRLHERHPHLPVVFMSGYSDGLLTAQYMIKPDAPLVQKPFTTAELLTAIHRTLHPVGQPAATTPTPTRK